MSEKKERVRVSLAEICEETRWAKDEKTGRRVKKPAVFSSMRALLQGAFSLVEYFEELHREGKVYEGNASDVFLFSLADGEMTCRFPEAADGATDASEAGQRADGATDVSEAGQRADGATDASVAGQRADTDVTDTRKAGQRTDRVRMPEKDALVKINEFLAPELVTWIKEGKNMSELPFTVETDRYFLAVFLFEYFFHTGSPFEGKKMVNRCFLSPLEKEVFRAERGQFCMDIGENENTPVTGIQDKLIHYWKEYPEMLRKMFQRAFLDGGVLLELRPTEVDWKQVLVRLLMDYQVCGCGFQGFSGQLMSQKNGTLVCPVCGRTYYVLSNGMDEILLTEGAKLYACQTGRDAFDKDTVTALVVENRQRKGLYGIKNISRGVWRGLFPDGSVREIREGQGIPIWNGMQVRFETGEEWSLRLGAGQGQSGSAGKQEKGTH